MEHLYGHERVYHYNLNHISNSNYYQSSNKKKHHAHINMKHKTDSKNHKHFIFLIISIDGS